MKILMTFLKKLNFLKKLISRIKIIKTVKKYFKLFNELKITKYIVDKSLGKIQNYFNEN